MPFSTFILLQYSRLPTNKDLLSSEPKLSSARRVRLTPILTCVLGGAVVAKGKNRDAQISQVEDFVRIFHLQ